MTVSTAADGRPEGGDLLQEPELLLGLAQDALQMAPRERLQQDEVGVLDGGVVLHR